MKDDKLLYQLRRKLQVCALRALGPVFMSKVYFYILLKQKLHLNNPKTFNEKLQWLKLYEWPKNSLAIQGSDKYLAREYVKSKGYEEILNDLIAVWESPEEINWDLLPAQFAIKCNHGCAYNLICPDKSKFDTVYATKKIKTWLNENFGEFNGEIYYDRIPKRIICEKYLGGEMKDYKFFCFNGIPEYLYISQGLEVFGEGSMTFLIKTGIGHLLGDSIILFMKMLNYLLISS